MSKSIALSLCLIHVRRDAVSYIPKVVRPWEVDCFKEKFGEGAVELVDEAYEVETINGLPEPAVELARLDKILGHDTERKQQWVETIFGRGKAAVIALKAVMNDCLEGEPEKEEKPKPVKKKATKKKAAKKKVAAKKPEPDPVTVEDGEEGQDPFA